MKRIHPAFCLLAITCLLAVWPRGVHAQGGFELVTGKPFDRAMPKDFYLEGNAIPTQKRNAALVKTPAGARLLFALIDTTGYSSQIQQKYEGMVISEGKFSICGGTIGVGSHGFGHTKPPAASNEDAKFFLYNQAGEKVAECAAKKHAELKQPKPLQVIIGKGEPTRLYLGRYGLELK